MDAAGGGRSTSSSTSSSSSRSSSSSSTIEHFRTRNFRVKAAEATLDERGGAPDPEPEPVGGTEVEDCKKNNQKVSLESAALKYTPGIVCWFQNFRGNKHIAALSWLFPRWVLIVILRCEGLKVFT